MKDKELRKIFERARKGDAEAMQKILDIFKPLIYQNSIIDGRFNEDCFQELNIKLMVCIKTFKFSPRAYKEVVNKEMICGEEFTNR